MKTRIHVFTLLLCLVALAACGCRRNIVLAEPPSVASPPPAEPASQPATAPPQVEAKPETPLPSTPDAADSASIALTPAVKPAPVRPRPAPVEPEPPKPAPEPQPPQISPELTPTQLADAQRRTTDDLRVAERTVQLASAKQLSASQNDLFDKIKGFDKDAHDAISANDWVRAENLAQKARVLSDELAKSL